MTNVAGTAYTYDENGNLTSDGTHTYTWDAQNRLIAGGSMSFSYDASGQRYKSVDSSSGEYTYYLNSLMEMREGTSTFPGTPTYYIFAGGQRVAMREGTGANVIYNHQDHLGGTSITTDSAGGVNQIYDYYPYGAELENTLLGTVDAAHSFTDKELDASLGLYYFEARWYSPTIGRFASGDPAQMGMLGKLIGDPQQLNYYSYARNNPIYYTDPTGQLTFAGLLLITFVPGFRDLYYGAWTYSQLIQDTHPVTSSYLEHSLTYNPASVQINESNQSDWGNLINEIKNSETFNSKIDNIIFSAESNGEKEINYSTLTAGETFKLEDSLDLKMAIGTVSGGMQVNGSQNDDGSWNLNISMNDEYHFEQSYTYDSGTGYQTANFAAATAQDAGLLSTFQESITFTYEKE